MLRPALLIFLLCLSAAAARAQSADSLLAAARKAAFDRQDYPEAIRLVQHARSTDPNNPETLVFLGRLHTWNKEPNSARRYLLAARQAIPPLADAFAASADLEYWEKNYDTALSLAQQGLALDGANAELMLRKAQILFEQKDYAAALGVADTLLRTNRGNIQARSLAERIRDHASKHRLGLKYDYIYFDKQFPDPWNYLSLDYTYQSKAGAFTARINYANRFRTDGLQYEVEAYPVLSRRFYAYLNVGYAEKAGVFPRWKGGASLFANLPRAFEAELGLRYLYFDRDAFIYTAYLAKYLGSFLIGARTYLAPGESNISESYSILARYYFGGVDDFVGIAAGAGVSPDDRQTNVQLNTDYRLKSYRGELTARKAIRKLNVLVLNASIMNQEYLPNTVGNQIQVGLGYIRRF